MKLVIANWKMNPQTAREAITLARSTFSRARKIKKIKLVVCPPHIWISHIRAVLKKPVELGAQDVAFAKAGAFTGEISPAMLKHEGCTFAIIGHSERRTMLNESDTLINRKVLNALEGKLSVVLAVGEQKREGSRHVVDAVLETQLKEALKQVKAKDAHRIAVAYEPVWAIGTGVGASAHDALQAALVVRKVFAKHFGVAFGNKVRVLYGGSVDAKNVAQYVNQPGIDGVLVGGASLNPRGFAQLLGALR